VGQDDVVPVSSSTVTRALLHNKVHGDKGDTARVERQGES